MNRLQQQLLFSQQELEELRRADRERLQRLKSAEAQMAAATEELQRKQEVLDGLQAQLQETRQGG